MVDPHQLQPLSVDLVEGSDLFVWVEAITYRTVKLVCGWDDGSHPVDSDLDLTGEQPAGFFGRSLCNVETHRLHVYV